jgi:hypothetical protein
MGAYLFHTRIVHTKKQTALSCSKGLEARLNDLRIAKLHNTSDISKYRYEATNETHQNFVEAISCGCPPLRLSEKPLCEKITQIKYGIVILSEAKNLVFRSKIAI